VWCVYCVVCVWFVVCVCSVCVCLCVCEWCVVSVCTWCVCVCVVFVFVFVLDVFGTIPYHTSMVWYLMVLVYP
jgi:hypothetical protein